MLVLRPRGLAAVKDKVSVPQVGDASLDSETRNTYAKADPSCVSNGFREATKRLAFCFLRLVIDNANRPCQRFDAP